MSDEFVGNHLSMRPARVFIEGIEGMDIITGPDFGCVNHEAS